MKLAHWPALALCGLLFALGFYVYADRLFALGDDPYRGIIEGKDDSYYYFWLRSVMVDGDVDFSNELEELPTMDEEQRERLLAESPRTPRELIHNEYPIGWALLSLPGYLCGALFGSLFGLSANGFDWHYQLGIALNHLLYTVAGLYFAWRICRRYTSPLSALLGVTLTWACSALFFYTMRKFSMTHHLVFFLAAFVIDRSLQLEEQPERRRHWLLIGLAAGLLILCRYQAALLLFHPIWVQARLVLAERRHVRSLLLGAAACFGVLLIQMLAWQALFGRPLVYSYGEEGFTNLFSPQLGNVLFSSFHGLYYWHPFLLIATAGFAWYGVYRLRASTVCWWLSLLGILYINAAWHNWWFGAAFGQRAFDGPLLFLMLGTAWLFHRLEGKPWPRRILMTFALLAAFWNFNLVQINNKSDLLSLEKPISWGEMTQASKAYWLGD